jgi:hypothetical protein
MMKHRAAVPRFRILTLSFSALAAFASPGTLYAQSCALCYQSAANSGPNFIQALKHGILVLLFPPLLIGAGVIVTAYRKRDQFAEDCEPAAE